MLLKIARNSSDGSRVKSVMFDFTVHETNQVIHGLGKKEVITTWFMSNGLVWWGSFLKRTRNSRDFTQGYLLAVRTKWWVVFSDQFIAVAARTLQ
jgi:hypothetical protein